jgi:hypothetical protein
VTPATARGWASVPGSSAQRAALAERFVDPIDCRYRWRIGDFGLRRNEQRVRVATLLGGLVLSGCAREQEPFLCPDVGEGELIITEIRGPQEGPDTWGQWIELHNPTDRDLDLFGLRVSMRPLDGDEPDVILVRVEGIALPAGKTVALEPGGYHIMLMELKQTLKAGDTVPLTLVIETADKQRREVQVKATVRALNSAQGAGKHTP